MFEVIYMLDIIPFTATFSNMAKARGPVSIRLSSLYKKAHGALVKFGPGREMNIRQPEATADVTRAVLSARAA